MEVVRLERFNVHPSEHDSPKQWKLWRRNFLYFLSTLEDHNPDKLEILYLYARIGPIGTKVAKVIESCCTFEDAMNTLNSNYLKPPSEIYSRNQHSDESVDSFLLALNSLASDCCFKDVSASVYREESVRDSFIRGLRSSSIRARLLENDTLDLKSTVKQAQALEQSQIRSESFIVPEQTPFSASAGDYQQEQANVTPLVSDERAAAAVRPMTRNVNTSLCYNCGGRRHPNDNRRLCPGKDSVWHTCGKMGHFAKVCKSNKISSAVYRTALLASVLSSSSIVVEIDGRHLKGLLDTGSSENFISETVVRKMNLPIHKQVSCVSMASSSLSVKLTGYCDADITV